VSDDEAPAGWVLGGQRNCPGVGNNIENSTGVTTMIKKYANRRLYDTEKSRYITGPDLAKMIRAGTRDRAPKVLTLEGKDVTAEVYVGIVSDLVRADRITADALLTLIIGANA
jgi:polyhydroxyalkanoate synthesis regulator protein